NEAIHRDSVVGCTSRVVTAKATEIRSNTTTPAKRRRPLLEANLSADDCDRGVEVGSAVDGSSPARSVPSDRVGPTQQVLEPSSVAVSQKLRTSPSAPSFIQIITRHDTKYDMSTVARRICQLECSVFPPLETKLGPLSDSRVGALHSRRTLIDTRAPPRGIQSHSAVI